MFTLVTLLLQMRGRLFSLQLPASRLFNMICNFQLFGSLIKVIYHEARGKNFKFALFSIKAEIYEFVGERLVNKDAMSVLLLTMTSVGSVE